MSVSLQEMFHQHFGAGGVCVGMRDAGKGAGNSCGKSRWVLLAYTPPSLATEWAAAVLTV
ncbi:hypothetical protein DSCW_45500 [Desulfosarcina widdelii]|uniref:Uncharacterized protein n=1 Tax=Desulfosarcina widdelii TaxID=947919 RepID=A0A5K7ZBI8_9BACT|nr:hypothetical protein DSCW_45500 [Desulfosarcina widdelii]